MNQIIYVASPESQEIHVFHMNRQGMLILRQIVNAPGKGKPIVIHPARTHLYLGIRPISSIVSYQIDKYGLLTEVAITALPASPTQLSIDCKGKMLYSVSYNGSSLAVCPIDKKGIVHISRQTLKGLIHCHSANVDSKKKVVWVPCLTENRIRLYSINHSGFLAPYTPEALDSMANTGPRHMVFHHTSNYAYVINELSSTVNVIAIDSSPRIVQTVDIMPPTFQDVRCASDIHITPDCRWLYCGDRTASLISQFSVSKDGGMLQLVGHLSTETQPRGFNIDSQGKFLVVAGEKSNYIAVYSIDEIFGTLSLLARYPVGQGPMWVSILMQH
ncbi:6-phosphogluconolactonase [secondary endosymbiont of Heteropsylla cubana]|nr:6-phosphogluconolactonase [secondary endosymbiont of Heteropsylla cubana]